MNEIAPPHVTETGMPDVARLADGQPACEPGPDAALCARAPIGMLCELTHRCPLQCPYCSNPLELERANTELTTAEWQDVMRQAAKLGVLQIHLSGGEPTARKDLEDIVKVAADVGLYTNLITAGVTLTQERLAKLAGNLRADCRPKLRPVLLARAQHAEHGNRFPLHRVRDADRRGLDDRWMGDRGRLDFGRPDALARNLERVVRATLDVPVAALVDERPVAVDPHAG